MVDVEGLVGLEFVVAPHFLEDPLLSALGVVFAVCLLRGRELAFETKNSDIVLYTLTYGGG